MFKILVLLMLSVYLVSGQNLPFQNLWGQQGRSGSFWSQNWVSSRNSNHGQGSNRQNEGNQEGPNCSVLQSAGNELEQMLGGGFRGQGGSQQQIRQLQRLLTQVISSHCGGMQNQGNQGSRNRNQGTSRGNRGYGGNRPFGY